MGLTGEIIMMVAVMGVVTAETMIVISAPKLPAISSKKEGYIGAVRPLFSL